MKIFIALLLFSQISFAGRDDQAQRIERDITVMISQLQLLLDKDPEQLLLPMLRKDRNQFEEDILKLKIDLEKVSRRFADQGRFPNGKVEKAKK
jgi:hypothetical protein